jgi:hypothetical protein
MERVKIFNESKSQYFADEVSYREYSPFEVVDQRRQALFASHLHQALEQEVRKSSFNPAARQPFSSFYILGM